MGLKYRGDDFAVFHGFFRSVRIRDLRSGNEIRPGVPLLATTLYAWTDLAKLKYSSRKARASAEAALFRDCGLVALGRGNGRTMHLELGLDRRSVAEHYWRQGEMAALMGDDD